MNQRTITVNNNTNRMNFWTQMSIQRVDIDQSCNIQNDIVSRKNQYKNNEPNYQSKNK
jgi:hypothetical protein